jgi:hypothetical protein
MWDAGCGMWDGMIWAWNRDCGERLVDLMIVWAWALDFAEVLYWCG